MEKKELSKEDKDKIVNLRKKFAEINRQIGDIELAKINLKKRKDFFVDEYLKGQKEEIDLSEHLKKTYGEGTINLDTDEFIPKEK